MQFHNQLVKHNPPESYGDCVRTCIANMLNREPQNVPHFFDEPDTQEAWNALDRWLNGEGYCMLVMLGGPIEPLQAYMRDFNADILYMMLGDGHAVVGCNGKILHDPSWTKQGVKNPTHIVFLLPISQRYSD